MNTSRFRALAATLVAGLAIAGCGQESGVKEETKVTTPDGSATVTKETKVETTGDNPPPVNTAPKNP
jgi:ABC-type glycerol-3-phosphate transport system substrate-binding protein